MKRFFVLLNHPPPLQKPLVMGILKDTHFVQQYYETSRNTTFLTKAQIKDLGYQSPPEHKAYLVPIDIPRDWFIY